MNITFWQGLVLIALAGFLVWRFRRDQLLMRESRARLLDECRGLLDDVALIHAQGDFPTLHGNYRGRRIQLRLISDSSVMRKRPVLWLLLTVAGRKNIAGSLDILARPQNTEFYSPAGDWDKSFAVPEHWPRHASYKTRDDHPPLHALETHVTEFFAQEKNKELLVMPDLVRMTWLAAQAERGNYLVLRSEEYGMAAIPRHEVEPLLERAVQLRDELEAVAA